MLNRICGAHTLVREHAVVTQDASREQFLPYTTTVPRSPNTEYLRTRPGYLIPDTYI